MDSGWIAFTTLVVIIVVALLGGLLKSYLFPVATATTDAFSTLFGGVFGGFIKMVLNIVPIALFAFGIVSDIIRQEVVGSIPTITSFLSLGLLRLITSLSFFQGNFPLFADQAETNSNVFWCSLPGLEFLENPVFPSSILTVTIIGFYYLWFAIGTQHQLYIGSLLGFALASVITQFTLGNCSTLFYPLLGLKGFGVILQTVVLGMLISGTLYGIISGIYPSKNPLGIIPNLPGSSSSAPVTPNIPGTVTPSIPGTVSCPSGQNYSPADSYGPAGCRCSSNNRPPINGRCYSSENPNQSTASSPSDQIVEARAYKNGVEVTQSLGV